MENNKNLRVCSNEGCNNPSWSKGLCKNHIPKKPIKVGHVFWKSLTIASPVRNQMHVFFKSIWIKRKHRCEITNVSLGKEALSVYFHHVLPKSKYPEAAFDEENIILLAPDIHENVEIDIYRYEEINRRREELLKKYNLV